MRWVHYRLEYTCLYEESNEARVVQSFKRESTAHLAGLVLTITKFGIFSIHTTTTPPIFIGREKDPLLFGCLSGTNTLCIFSIPSQSVRVHSRTQKDHHCCKNHLPFNLSPFCTTFIPIYTQYTYVFAPSFCDTQLNVP